MVHREITAVFLRSIQNTYVHSVSESVIFNVKFGGTESSHWAIKC